MANLLFVIKLLSCFLCDYFCDSTLFLLSHRKFLMPIRRLTGWTFFLFSMLSFCDSILFFIVTQEGLDADQTVDQMDLLLVFYVIIL